MNATNITCKWAFLAVRCGARKHENREKDKHRKTIGVVRFDATQNRQELMCIKIDLCVTRKQTAQRAATTHNAQGAVVVGYTGMLRT